MAADSVVDDGFVIKIQVALVRRDGSADFVTGHAVDFLRQLFDLAIFFAIDDGAIVLGPLAAFENESFLIVVFENNKRLAVDDFGFWYVGDNWCSFDGCVLSG